MPLPIYSAMKFSLKHALYQHYLTPAEQIFPQFKLGAMIFMAGLIVIYIASQILSPSLQQELMTLLWLLIILSGFIVALMAQVRMLIGRLLRFFTTKAIFDD